MRNKILISLASTLTVLSACMLPNKTTILEPKKESSEDRIKAEFLEQFRNKQQKTIDKIDISINTELQDNNKETNNVFSILSDKNNKTIVRKKEFLVGEHPTNESHTRDKDSNILEFKALKNTKLFKKVA